MTAYRRARENGGTYFFTVNLAERRGNSLLVDHIDRLRAAFRYTRARHPFDTLAIAVLPDHLHAVWQLPEGCSDYAIRWSLIKGRFSRAMPRGEQVSGSRCGKRERGIWQRRYWEHQIRDEEDFRRHVEYIHYNPVKHGHASCPLEWPYSSFRRYVSRGIYPADWAAGEDVIGMEFE